MVISVAESQGLDSLPSSLVEYWLSCGRARRTGFLGLDSVEEAGIWRELAKFGGFSVEYAFGSRLVAIDVAARAGFDWKLFGFAEPRVTFKQEQGEAVYWVEFDPDEPDHDPPVWVLEARVGSVPRQISDSFSAYVRDMVDAAARGGRS